jgi:transcriptional regulator with XRE-family HTH domain
MPRDQRRGPNLPSADDLIQRGDGAALHIARVSRGITQRELSAKTRIDVSYLSAYENGRLKPGPTHTARLVKVLGPWE